MPTQKGRHLKTYLDCPYINALNFNDKQELKVQGYDVVRKTKIW